MALILIYSAVTVIYCVVQYLCDLCKIRSLQPFKYETHVGETLSSVPTLKSIHNSVNIRYFCATYGKLTQTHP